MTTPPLAAEPATEAPVARRPVARPPGTATRAIEVLPPAPAAPAAPAALAAPATPAVSAAPSLARLARAVAADLSWLPRVRLSARGRWYERLDLDLDSYLGRDIGAGPGEGAAPGGGRGAEHREDEEREAWLISWLPGQATGFHDHGGARGAFAVALGTLQEHDLGGSRTFTTGDVRGFGARHVHDVRNASAAPAVSVHVYSPPLSVMNRYDLTDSGLVRLGQERAGDW